MVPLLAAPELYNSRRPEMTINVDTELLIAVVVVVVATFPVLVG